MLNVLQPWQFLKCYVCKCSSGQAEFYLKPYHKPIFVWYSQIVNRINRDSQKNTTFFHCRWCKSNTTKNLFKFLFIVRTIKICMCKPSRVMHLFSIVECSNVDTFGDGKSFLIIHTISHLLSYHLIPLK